MPQNVYTFILRHSKKEQIVLLILAVISYPFLYYSYDLPKLIINYITEVSQFVSEPANADAKVPAQSMFGIELDHVQYLLALCFAFLTLVLVNGGFKYFINVFKGQLGERMLRRLRFELFSRVLRFPLPHFKKVSSAEIIPMITAEVEPLGGFIGDAFVQPIFQGGMLIVPLVFILAQDWALGLAAIALYPVQIFVIPKLQRRVNALGKQRVRAVRQLSQRIGESIAGVQEIHANDTSMLERASFSERLGAIYGIRFHIYKLKFFTKFLINAIDKMTPFFFYTIGGYLVMEGRLDIGAMVAVIAAQKDLASPAKELLAYYQQKEDVRIKYEQVIGQFGPAGMVEMERQENEPEAEVVLSGQLDIANLSLTEEDGVKLIDSVTMQVDLGGRVAIVGDGGSGKDELALVLGNLLQPTGGRIALGDLDFSALPETVAGRRIAYVGQSAHMFSDSVRNNLYYGLKHRPLIAPDLDDATLAERRRLMSEAGKSGNLDMDVMADWVDYAAAGVAGGEELTALAIETLRLVDLEDDVYQMGLRGTIDPGSHVDLATRILEVREALRVQVSESGMAELIEPFDGARYNTNATVAENLLFGTPVDEAFAEDNLAANAYLLEVLEKAGLTTDLLEIGRQVAETMVELFSGLPPGHEFFEQFSFISSDDLPDFQAILGRVSHGGFDQLPAEDRQRLLALPFKLIPARHRLDLMDEAMQARILEARGLFAEGLPEDKKGAVAFFDAEKYNDAASIQDNVLFGKVVYGQAEGPERVGKAVSEVLESLGLRPAVMEVGLEFQVGIAGSRLSSGQRQKLGFARCLLKKPDMMVVNQATAALDGRAQNQIMTNLLERFSTGGLLWFLHRPSLASYFDRVFVMRAGRVVESGNFEELSEVGSLFAQLVEAE